MAYYPGIHQGIRVRCSPDAYAAGAPTPCGPLQSRGFVQSFKNDAEGCDWNRTTDFWDLGDEKHQQPSPGAHLRRPSRPSAPSYKVGNQKHRREQSPVARVDCSRPSPGGQGWVYTDVAPLPMQIPSSQKPCQFLQPFHLQSTLQQKAAPPPVYGHRGQEINPQQIGTWWPLDCQAPVIEPDVIEDERSYHATPHPLEVQYGSWWSQDCNMPIVEPDSSWDAYAAARQEAVYTQQMHPAVMSHQARVNLAPAHTPVGEKGRDCCVPLNKNRSCTVDINSCLDPPVDGDDEVEADFRHIQSNHAPTRFPSPPVSKGSVTSTMSSVSLWDLLG